MNENAYLHFHRLELRESFRQLAQIMPPEQAQDVIAKFLGDGGRYYHEFIAALDSHYPRQQYEDDKIAYYLTAGCGIIRIIRLLNVGQSRIYRVKKAMQELEERPRTSLHFIMLQEPSVIPRLQLLMDHLNVFHGFRVLNVAQPHMFLDGQVRNDG